MIKHNLDNGEELLSNGEPVSEEVRYIHYASLQSHYARNRKAEYDKLNQFELQFDDIQDNGTRWVDAVNEIKSKYPKPN